MNRPLHVPIGLPTRVASVPIFVCALVACGQIAGGPATPDDGHRTTPDPAHRAPATDAEAVTPDAATVSAQPDASDDGAMSDAAFQPGCAVPASVCVDAATLRSYWVVVGDGGECVVESSDYACPESTVGPACVNGGCRITQNTK